MSERISIAGLRESERVDPWPEMKALLDLAEAAHAIEAFVPPLHRAALTRYLGRFDFAKAHRAD